MKNLLSCRELNVLDENCIKPNCNVYNKELTMFIAEEGFSEKLREALLEQELGKYDNGKFYFLMCKNCVKLF